MANTLTGLIPIIYRALDTISRELVGFIPSVYMNATAEQAAVGQDITYPVVGANTAGDITAAATGPDPGDRTTGTGSMSITKSRGVPFYRTGEETLGLGGLHKPIVQLEFEQAMRTLVNEVEGDLAALQAFASRAYAAHATDPAVPFGSDLSELAQVRKILADNGAPPTDLQAVINTTAGAKLRSLGQLTKANEAGGDDMLRRGVLLDVHGFALRESAAVVDVTTVGADVTNPYAVDGAHAVGATDITIKTGAGTILAGDVITFSNDTSIKYVVETGVDNGTSITLRAPGLVKALAGDETIVIVAACARNVAFDRNAMHLLARVPAMPEGGDAADDVITVTDPVSGLTFQVAMYRQRRRVAYEVGLAWGVSAVKTPHMALLLGQ